ncbi:hypothetical protein K390107E64_40490 [Escherichia coli]
MTTTKDDNDDKNISQNMMRLSINACDFFVFLRQIPAHFVAAKKELFISCIILH